MAGRSGIASARAAGCTAVGAADRDHAADPTSSASVNSPRRGHRERAQRARTGGLGPVSARARGAARSETGRSRGTDDA